MSRRPAGWPRGRRPFEPGWSDVTGAIIARAPAKPARADGRGTRATLTVVGDTFRWIRSGAGDELTPLRQNETWVRVDRVLPEDAWPRLAELLSSRPDVQLSIEAGEDLEMLRWFPGLHSLAARSLRLTSLDGLRHVAGALEELALGDTLKRLSMRAVGDLPRLRRLGVNGSWKDVDTVGRLVGLERLGIGSVDLEWLRPLTGLRRFECGLGTIANISILDEIGRLELVELWRLRGEHDLASLGRISTLRYLVLDSTRSVTALPSLARLSRPPLGQPGRDARDHRPPARSPTRRTSRSCSSSG